jgi:choline dehydrogenase-like flavoprotein
MFDAVMVGSGATGGLAANKLTEAGMQVMLVEAGNEITEAGFCGYNSPARESFSRPPRDNSIDSPIQVSCSACGEPKHEWFVKDIETPMKRQDLIVGYGCRH